MSFWRDESQKYNKIEGDLPKCATYNALFVIRIKIGYIDELTPDLREMDIKL